LDDTAISIDIDGFSFPIFAIYISKHQGVVSVDYSVVVHNIELHSVVRVADILEVIIVERIISHLASTGRAIRTSVSSVALTAHGDVLVPQAVHVLVVESGQLLDCVAGSMT
jgi:hypothetical protein